MSPVLKRLILILAITAVLIAIMAAVFYWLNKKTITTGGETGGGTITGETEKFPTAGGRGTGETTEVTETGGTTGLPTAGQVEGSVPVLGEKTTYRPEAVTQVVSERIVFPSLSTQGDMRYHNATDGKFYRIMPDGSIKILSDQVFYSVQNVTWAGNKDKAVIEYPDGAKIIYNFDTGKQVTLPKHWQEFSFSADSNELAAKSIGLAPENRWLVTVRDDGTGTKLIEPMGNNADKVIIDWSPSRQTAAFSQTGAAMGGDRREVLFIGLNGENFKSITAEGLDFVPQWSPTGQKLLYSVDSARSNYKPELWISNAYGDQIGTDRQLLNLNTWADKCSFGDDNTLFCAVPVDLPEGAGMAPEIANNINDYLYKIDLKNGSKTSIPLKDDYTIDTISYNAEKNKLYFTDKNKEGIFEVNL